MFLLLWYIFISSAAILFLYNVICAISIANYKSSNKLKNKEGVSVVVCARNEYQNLKKIIPAILKQNHEKFELIIVDDQSTDESYAYLKELSMMTINFKLVRIDETPIHLNEKKYAIILGIKAAENDIILLTDADCETTSDDWISTMTAPFADPKIKLSIGFSPYKKTKGFLNAFIRYETWLTAISYFVFSRLGRPYMGVGRNLAYRKSFFLELDGFKGFQNVLGGDDDLFVNKYANKGNTAVVLQHNGITFSNPKELWKDFFIQKTRHLSVGKLYRFKDRFVLGVLFLTKLIFWLTFTPVILADIQPILTIMGFILVMVSFLTTYILFRNKLKDLKGAWLFPVLDILYLFYYIIVGLKVKFTKKVKWN